MTFESTLRPGIHVVGDAADAGAMPKTAFCANTQAKACAAAILSALTGSRPAPPHLLDAHYTFLAGNDAMGDAATFRPADGTIARANDALEAYAGLIAAGKVRTDREHTIDLMNYYADRIAEKAGQPTRLVA